MAEQIFEEVDDQNLTKCRGISNTWYDATERIQWTRKIQKLTKENKNHQNSWKSRVSVQGVKSLGGHYACLCWEVGVLFL